ncbi:dynamin family protein [Marivita sp. S0852]|uniref:dynamin family protein n=1 Tax=Marivita sp. S0852 TaxID=3373893 RepID=UPI0039824F9E
MTTQNRKPRIALMGEFSSGKSTLSNLLLGARPLPEKVTATRLSPVWMSAGTAAPYRVDVDGHEEPISIEDLDGIPVEETRVIRLFFKTEVLELCDLIDFPGISDPNMSSDVWQRMLDEVDAVVWCTHATQAWRQSEASVWETIPAEVRARSILLVTKFDKLTTERDGRRVLARLAKETDGLFAATFPVSLTAALAAEDDYAAFDASGGLDFLQYFLKMVEDLTDTVATTEKTLFATHQTVKPPAAKVEASQPTDRLELPSQDAPVSVAAVASPAPEPQPELKNETPSAFDAAQTAEPDNSVSPERVIPRRVKPKNVGARQPRPRIRAEASTMSASELAALTTSRVPMSNSGPKLRSIFQEGQSNSQD